MHEANNKPHLLLVDQFMKSKKAIVIGAGIGGIATSIRLAVKGYHVVVYEQNGYPGGKLSTFKLGPYRFDAGPSLFTMPHFVDQLFELAGEQAGTSFSYKRKEIICQYYWDDGKDLTAYADANRFKTELYEKLGVAPQVIEDYWTRAKAKYELTASLFLEQSLHKLTTYLSKDTLKAIFNLSKLDLNKSLDQVNRAQLRESHLVQFYNRFATYNGSSPYQTPGIMSLIPHLEQHFGTFIPEKGMHSITNSLYELAKRKGVQFHFLKNVTQIRVENNAAKSVVAEGQEQTADLIVSNMDIVPTYRRLLRGQPAPEKVLKQPRSSSALIFYWGIKKQFPQLDLHNIFFTADYKREFEAIFQTETVYEDPTVYVNITSKDIPEDAPEGKENWFVMINVPSNKGQDWDQLITKARAAILKKLSKRLGEDLQKLIEIEDVLDPRLIEQKTYSYQGALYGASSNNRLAAFLRHPNFSRKIKNLYFCGGSVHPGGGIPLCLLSAKIVSELVPEV